MTDVHATAVIDSGAELGEGVSVGPYAVIGKNVRIGAGSKIMSHVVLDGWTTVGANCTLFPFACVGTQTQDLKYRGAKTTVEIGDGTVLREYVTVNSSTNEGDVTHVGAGCFIMAYCHVAHACRVGDHVIMANCATLAGEVTVEDRAIIGGLTAVHQFTRVGRMCMVGGCTAVRQDCPPYMLVAGNPAEVSGPNVVGLKRSGMSEESRRGIKEAYKILYLAGLPTSEALARIKAELPGLPEVAHIVEFVEKSERGITK